MPDRADAERQIEAALTAADLDSVTFSNRLFGQPDGLFAALTATPDERRAVVASDLWRRAKARLRELEREDLDRFRRIAERVQRQQTEPAAAG
jgi:hypothetical protein